ncbi:hypothetical protein TRVL_04558 [Trypanosoma vivax]|nr:hypothetical protein TRVL_04558 [Trypanosoma vivax]
MDVLPAPKSSGRQRAVRLCNQYKRQQRKNHTGKIFHAPLHQQLGRKTKHRDNEKTRRQDIYIENSHKKIKEADAATTAEQGTICAQAHQPCNATLKHYAPISKKRNLFPHSRETSKPQATLAS